MKLMNAKGTRDFPPDVKILRQEIVDTLRKSFELYGFVPLETPILERFDILSAKYAGGSEIMKETFQLQDQGKRELGLRFDLTVPLSRYVGMNPNLKMPFKRYQIGRVFRDGPIKTGRYREFWQCDIDIVGCKGMLAEAELLAIAEKAFATFGLKTEIKVNNRKLLSGMIRAAGITTREDDVILTIDKLEKTGEKGVRAELEGKGVNGKQADKLIELFSKKTIEEIEPLVDEEGKVGADELKELFSYLKQLGVSTCRFDPSLARGLSYYTGTICEAFLIDSEITSACMGGGRYNNMISDYLGSKQQYPAVGISFGLEVLTEVMKEKTKASTATVFVIPLGTQKECLQIAEEFRNANINTEMDLLGRSISKNLNYANQKGIPFVAIIGEDEVKAGKIKLKNMESGEEKLVGVKEGIGTISQPSDGV